MCGIAGIFSARENRSIAELMTDFVRHRGPDDAGVEDIVSHDGRTAGTFGHRRLAILDLSAKGHQPMFSHDRNLCITFNGEIYNFMDLRREMEQSGVKFTSGSDTEVILAGWKREGPRFLHSLRGMFALALWDRDAGTGYLVRDTFGIKPLYLARCNGDVLFASEVRALLATGCIPRKLSRDGLASYLSTGSVAEPFTIIEGITSIPAGCVVEIVARDGSLSVQAPQPFAEPSAADDGDDHPGGSHVGRIRDALRESVGYHLVSDVPVAVFLSGGIDSSAVAGLASEISARPLEGFTVVFEEADFSEAAAARLAAHRFGMNHHEVMLSGQDLLEALPDVFESMDQPSLDGLNTFVVSRAVRSFGLKVVLSGLGGDELFGGYPSFLRAQQIAPLWKLPRAMRELGSAFLSPFDDARAQRVGGMLGDETASLAAYRASRTLFDDRFVSRLMADDSPPGRPAPEAPAWDEDGMNTPQRVSHYELTGYMRNTLLRDSDVFSMAHALELRVPMVDVQVAKVAHRAAREMRLKRGTIKPLLVEAVRDLLPPENISRPKMGFTLPFDRWMRKELFSEVDLAMNQTAAERVGIDYSDARDIWKGFQTRKSGVSWSRPWALYTLMRWAEQNNVVYEQSNATALSALQDLYL